MNVKQLIEKLNELDSEAEVMCQNIDPYLDSLKIPEFIDIEELIQTQLELTYDNEKYPVFQIKESEKSTPYVLLQISNAHW